MTHYVVSSGVTSSGLVISGGSTLTLRTGGTAVATIVLNGGLEIASSGSSDSGAIVSSGGKLSGYGMETGKVTVFSGAIVEDLCFGSGGVDLLYAGGVQDGLTISRGGVLDLARLSISKGQTVTVSVVTQTTASSGTNLLSGAVLETYSATVFSGGAEVAASGGFAIKTAVHGGGLLTISSDGQSDSATISAGGALNIKAGGVGSGDIVLGTETVLSGGKAISATLSGGSLVISSGGVLSGALRLSGGTATVSGAMASGATVSFSGSGGDLVLDNLPAFSAKIAGLTNSSQKIDLGGFAYSSAETRSWSQTGTSGTLTVSDGGKVAHLTLIGTYVTSNFTLSDDGHGGTYVVDPPVAGFAQAMAVVGGGSRAAIAGAPHTSSGSAGAIGAQALTPAGATSGAGRA